MATGTGVNRGKTAFLEDFLPGNRGADLDAINEAWRGAGNEGTVSDSLVGKLRSKLGLTAGRGRKGGSDGPTGKAKSSRRKTGGGKAPASGPSKPDGCRSARVAGGQNKTEFIRDQLGRDGSLDAGGINRAWTEAGREGSISPNLYYKTKADLGLTGRRKSSSRSSDGPAAGRSPEGPHAALESYGSDPSARELRGAAPAADGPRDRALVELEGEIDELIYRVRDLGELAEVQEALRAARRLLVRSHGA